MKENGYEMKRYDYPVKRYCQTMDLKDDPEMIAKYREFDWESAMAKLATLPRQQEWEDFVSIFQQCRKGELAKEKWSMMERMFYLYE